MYLYHIPCPDRAIIIASKQDPPCSSGEEDEDYMVEFPPSPLTTPSLSPHNSIPLPSLCSPSNLETTIVTWTQWPYRFWRSRVWMSQRWYWVLYRTWSPGRPSDQTSGSITESITSSLHHTLYKSASVQYYNTLSIMQTWTTYICTLINNWAHLQHIPCSMTAYGLVHMQVCPSLHTLNA